MASQDEIRIAHLIDAPEAVPALVDWFVAEWTPWYGPDGPGNAQSDLADCSSRDTLPISLVAFNAAGALLGTAALKDESVGSEHGVGPWLAAVLVAEPHQGKGVGSALVAAIEKEAARLGFDAIYTSTDTAGGIMQRRGWQAFGATDSLRGPLTIYRLQIRSDAPAGR